MSELLDLYNACLSGKKGMWEFVSYAEGKAIFGCPSDLAAEIDKMYLDLKARNIPDFVLPC